MNDPEVLLFFACAFTLGFFACCLILVYIPSRPKPPVCIKTILLVSHSSETLYDKETGDIYDSQMRWAAKVSVQTSVNGEVLKETTDVNYS